jgi:hypothetical protein
MNFYIIAVIIYIGLMLVGFGLSVLTSLLKCSKMLFSEAIQEGAIWATLPTFFLLLTKWSPYVLHIFSEPIKGFSSSLTTETSEMIGTGYLMMLGSWVMTTRMIHSTEIAVCKPSKAELAKFRNDLEKELKEKEDAKQENQKPTQ